MHQPLMHRFDPSPKTHAPAGCKKLTGSESWRIRVGDYRVIYNVLDTVLLIIIIDIGNRKEIYR